MTFKLIREYSKDLNVLYVEDDKELLHSTKEVLENYFQCVDSANDGQEGLETYKSYIDTNGQSYDLVITDINMPRMNGIEFTRNILMHNPQQPILIISAHDDSEYLLEAIDIGVSGFITKPINHQRLSKILYKTSMAISDHKYVERHLDTLEDLNMMLQQQNSELNDKNEQLEKSLRLLNTITHKEELLHPKKKSSEKTIGSNDDVNNLKEQIRHFIENDIYELKELLNEIDLVVIEVIKNRHSLGGNTSARLVALFKKYATTLSMYTFFDELSLAMSTFTATLEDNPLPENEEHINNVFLLLEGFLYDLSRWHEDLLSGDENKINAFDASNIVNMRLITNMWTVQEEEGESDLDAIFDF